MSDSGKPRDRGVTNQFAYRTAETTKAWELATHLATLRGVRRVDSLSSVQVVSRLDSGAVSLEAPLVRMKGDSAGDLQADLVGLAKSSVRQLLVSEDASVVAINVVLSTGPEQYYDQILAPVFAAQSSHGFRVSGVPVFRVAADSRTRSELIRLVPAAVILIGLLLSLLLRSPLAGAIGLVPGAIGSVVALGTMGWLGVPLTITTVILPVIFLALGCAYAVHFLVEGAPCGPQGVTRLIDTSRPVSLSGLTTAIGFVGVSLVKIEVVRSIGGFGALGVLAILAATLTVVPALVVAVRLRGSRPRWPSLLAERLLGLSLRRTQIVLTGGLMFLIGGVLGALQVRVETDVIEWFDRADPVRQDYEFIARRLSGISPINVVLDLPTEDGGITPDLIRALRTMEREVEADPRVGRVLSVAGPIWELHESFAALEPGGGLSELALEQYLLVLESEDFFGDFVDASRTRVNVLIRVNDNHSGALLEVAELAEKWWERSGIEGVRAQATGIMYEFARAEDEIALGQLRGLLFALVAVGVVLLLSLRSVLMAALALLANIVPLAIAFGAMGIFGVALDAGTVLVGNLVIGIAVDDTIHLVSRFKEQRDKGADVQFALHRSMARVIRALVLTTVAVSAGFAILAVSEFQFVANLGLLMAGALILCLASDLVLLPALLARALGPWRETGVVKE